MKNKSFVTAAVRVLREHDMQFGEFVFPYEERGGTALGAESLQVAEHMLIKTLIMEDHHKRPLIVLMHGDRRVSTKQLARLLNVKSISPCDPCVANKHSGYLVGGTSPFGTRRATPIYMETSILELPEIYINGGRRGYLLKMSSYDMRKVLQPTLVSVAV